MYVCCCEGVTDRQIKISIENGNILSFNDLCDKFGIANNCGKCLEEVREIFNESIKRVLCFRREHCNSNKRK